MSLDSCYPYAVPQANDWEVGWRRAAYDHGHDPAPERLDHERLEDGDPTF